MPPLPVVTGDEAIRAFAKLGYVLHHWKGSHAILRNRVNDRHLSVPGGRKELAPGTLRDLIRTASITVDDFIRQLND